MSIFIIILIATLSTAALVPGGGGGGGGGGQGGGTTTTPSPTFNIDNNWNVSTEEANTYRSSEYNNQAGLEQIKAAQAYAALEKNGQAIAGEGITIAIIDTGVQTNHSEIVGRYLSSGSYDYVNSDSNPYDDNGHGTFVASIAAGNKNNSGIHGVAFNSNIIAEKILDASGSTFSYNNINLAIRRAADNDAKVLNLSFGGNASTTMKGGLTYAKSKDSLQIAATGNDNDTSADFPASYASDPTLAGYIIAVGAVDSSSNIASFSNLCGSDKDYCLVAPGVDSVGAYPVDQYAIGSGTSFSTAFVSGAAATIRAAWPHLTAPQVTEILLETATDLGESGVDETYGHGLLNLYLAVQAQGSNEFAFGASVDSTSYDIRNSYYQSDPIFGDAFINNIAPALESAVFFDKYGRDYSASLDKKITTKNYYQQINLENIALNNYRYQNLPIFFGENSRNNLNFNIAIPKNNTNNQYGLRHITLDNSIDPQLNRNNGFSFVRNSSDILEDFKIGFAFNRDEVAKSDSEFGNFGFISWNNIASNPYQSFFNDFSQNRKFNQFFAEKKFFEKQLSLKFSNQTSYNSNQINSGLSNKENQSFDFTSIIKTKNNGSFLLSFGNLTEFNDNLLNSKAVGAFENQGNTKTSYLKFSSNQNIAKNLYLLSSISEGVSKIQGNNQGIFRNFQDVRSRSATISLIYDNFLKGKIGLSYHEPMRVYKGRVNIDIPTARTIDGQVIRYQTSASLASKGQEQNLELFYNRSINKFSTLNINLISQKEAGNIKEAKNNYLGWVSYNLMF
jgi:hypothetical protein